MSYSTAPSEYSADESVYITSRPRRNPSTNEEHDPLEDSDAATRETPTRSSTPVLPPPAPEHPQPATRVPRVRVTARKRVPIPVRVTLRVPPRVEEEPSRSRTRSMTPPPVTGVPVGRPQGMTPTKSRWVLGMALDVRSHEYRLDQYHHFIDGLTMI